jgi:hypothetical protein
MAYWYVRLFLDIGFQDFSLYISAALSICLLAYAVLFYWQAVKDKILDQQGLFTGKSSSQNHSKPAS